MLDVVVLYQKSSRRYTIRRQSRIIQASVVAEVFEILFRLA